VKGINVSSRPSIDLTGDVVMVTGATGDIGAEYVCALVSAGADVIATDVAQTAAAGEELADRATGLGPGKAIFTTVDVTSDDDLAAAAVLAVERFGGLDALINNAAIYRSLGPKRSLRELSNDDWDTTLRVNVRGSWQAIKAVTPLFIERGGGRVVNISSTVARAGVPGFAHYVASKAAVDGLTRAAARELGAHNIRVNGVAPGLVSDSATEAINPDGYAARSAQTRALAREMTPSDLVGAVLWLASQTSGFVTGQTILVDGGQVFA
jgi:NAD(P)-dependent dehydrogenase (short-subunit alcohol dehydrogenase family)